ncbi:GNAT family N-acetyltransferase [Mesobacillus maritimus]|uniref:GNAT family N-acetyltransferase n=1 Tax=Mesobacillus maritimus TaxID=1643336 RepID=A0ABS7K744_9BACI|nr:GNAT family N-acetyltransferase [Mesobacillus maritimus]MBY0098092.1 GNAT family N-acetyltransferase [Mesobacillus maritimus]
MFETKRCLINTLRTSDSEEVKRLFINPEVRKFLGGVPTVASMEGILNEMVDPTATSYYWVIREKNTNEFIGFVSLDPHHDGDDLELSYQLLPKWWGAGYGTEVVKRVLQFAFNELNLPKVVAETQSKNTFSCRLLERLGMELERTTIRFCAEQSIYSIKHL